jgi:hypothetical protein
MKEKREPAFPHTLCSQQTETDCNFWLAPHRTADHCLAGLLPASGDLWSQ